MAHVKINIKSLIEQIDIKNGSTDLVKTNISQALAGLVKDAAEQAKESGAEVHIYMDSLVKKITIS